MRDRESDGPGESTASARLTLGAVDLNQLRTFLAVHRSGSFTAAARLLGLSQPSVTAQIRALEQHLDRELFERHARGVSALPSADDLAARVAAPLDALAAATGTDGAGDGVPEPLRLAGPAELLCRRVLPALGPLIAGGVRLRVSFGLTNDLLDALRAGHHDLVVATTRPRGRTLTALPFADEEFELVAAPVWAERLDGQELPDALHRVPLVVYAEDLPIARRYWRHVFGRRLNCRAAVTVPDLRGVIAAVTAGAGFSVVPRYLCEDELAGGGLVPLHSPADPPINTSFLVQRPATTNPVLAQVRDRLLTAARTW